MNGRWRLLQQMRQWAPWGAEACWSALRVLVSESAWQAQAAAVPLESSAPKAVNVTLTLCWRWVDRSDTSMLTVRLPFSPPAYSQTSIKEIVERSVKPPTAGNTASKSHMCNKCTCACCDPDAQLRWNVKSLKVWRDISNKPSLSTASVVHLTPRSFEGAVVTADIPHYPKLCWRTEHKEEKNISARREAQREEKWDTES